jgi:hypothetical protein
MSCAVVEVDTKAHIPELIKLTYFARYDLAASVLGGPNHVFLSGLAGEKDRRRTGFELWLTYATELRLPIVLHGGRIHGQAVRHGDSESQERR